jgi:hypothetical protein
MYPSSSFLRHQDLSNSCLPALQRLPRAMVSQQHSHMHHNPMQQQARQQMRQQLCTVHTDSPAARRHTPPEDKDVLRKGKTGVEEGEEEESVVLDEDEEAFDDKEHAEGPDKPGYEEDDDLLDDLFQDADLAEDASVNPERVGIMSLLNSADQVPSNSSEDDGEFDVEFDEAWEDEEEVDDLQTSSSSSHSEKSKY